MTARAARTLPRKISALISDVDGTLVTDDKSLTPRAIAGAAALRAHGVAFAIISSRPPRGLVQLIETLNITSFVAGFNGGVIAKPDGAVLALHALLPPAARQSVDLLEANGAQAWVFSGDEWLVRDGAAWRVQHEAQNLRFAPKAVVSFGDALDAAVKIVGVSEDRGLLARCESDLRARLGAATTLALSPHFFLDITAPDANKGAALRAMAKLLSVPLGEIAVIGDGANDTSMFALAGLSIAMGNASPDVQGAADFVTAGNNQDGFAQAVNRFVLADARQRVPPA